MQRLMKNLEGVNDKNGEEDNVGILCSPQQARLEKAKLESDKWITRRCVWIQV